MDGRWVPRLRAGDPDAYELLFHSWYPEAYRTAYLITHRRELAEEAVQEAFCHVIRAIGTLRDPSRLRAWLHAIVTRAAVDAVRREAQARRVSLEDVDAADGVPAWPAAAPADPEEAALAHLRAEAVLAALAQLPPEFRQVVVLFYYHQLSVAEIAAHLGCPEGTVKSRLARARARLAAALAAQGVDPDG